MIDDGELDDGDFLPLLHHLVAAGLSRVDAERTVAEVLAYVAIANFSAGFWSTPGA
jgi:hypothetical protein